MGKSLSCRLHARLLPSASLAPGSLERKDTLLCRRRHAKGPLPLVGVSRVVRSRPGIGGFRRIRCPWQPTGRWTCRAKPASVGEPFEPDADWRKAVTCRHGNDLQKSAPKQLVGKSTTSLPPVNGILIAAIDDGFYHSSAAGVCGRRLPPRRRARQP